MGPSCRAQQRERRAGPGAAVAIVTILSTNAIAADFPDVTGTWAILNKGRSAPIESSVVQSAQIASLAVKILRQDGQSFSGTVVGPKGKSERIVGSFRRDGVTFIYSSEKTAGAGKVQGNEMEICRTDAGCALLTRSK
jgi:hypothetical protein